MNVYRIYDPRQILHDHRHTRGYTGLDLQTALQSYFDRYGKAPEHVYILENKTMKAIYCVVPEEKKHAVDLF